MTTAGGGYIQRNLIVMATCGVRRMPITLLLLCLCETQQTTQD